MSRPLRVLIALLLLLVAGPMGSSRAGASQSEEAWAQLEGARPCHVRVLWWSEPQSCGTVSWSTAVEAEESYVELRERGSKESLRFDSARNGRFSGSEADGGVFFHHAPYAGLSPDTTYELVAVSDGQRSPTHHFRTAPMEDQPFTLLYGGDARTMHDNRLRMNRLIRDRVEAEPEILAFVHGGDYVMDGRSWREWRLWLSHHEVCTARDGRLLPMIPARGNHDWGLLFDEVFDAPGGPQRNFGAIELGRELALVTLNTNISTAGEQALWMEQALPRLREEHRWLFVQYHRPMWPALKAPSEAKPLWVPLFEANDVDLVMESDGHVLKRTVPIRGDKFDPTGVTYIGEGGLGAPLRRPRRDLWYLQPPGIVAPGLHITLIDVASSGVELRSLGPVPQAEELQLEESRVLLGRESEWRWSPSSAPEESWSRGAGAAASWATARPADWKVTGGEDAGTLCRAWVRLDGEELRGVSDLGLLVPRGIPLVVWLEGEEVGRRSAWREGNPWDLREERFGEQRVEYLPLRELAASSLEAGAVLAVELQLDPGAPAGRGPLLEVLAGPPERAGAGAVAEPPLLDHWRLAPRVTAVPR
jgi:hypothetical protein